MADYDIERNTLASKKSELEELKTGAEDIYNELNSCYIGTISDPELTGIKSKLKEPIERLKKGYSNSNTWYNNYTKDLDSLESELSSFSGTNLTSPTEFGGEFTDMFGKRTMPIIKTGGDIHANAVIVGDTQAKEFYALGDKAYNEYGDYNENTARAEWIKKVAEIVKNTNTYGMKKSLIIAQIINESGWMSSHASSLSNYNNVLGVNYDMGKIKPEMQSSTWSKKKTSGYNDVTQWSSDGTHIVGTNEDMRHYDSVEECIEDYANIMSLYHPECVGSNNIEDYRSFLESYTPNPNSSTTDKYRNIIKKYNLEQYDS